MRKTMLLMLAFASTAAVAEEAKKDDGKQKVVCREELDTGSRLSGKRVCLTRGEWAERKRHDREAAEHAQTMQMNRSGG